MGLFQQIPFMTWSLMQDGRRGVDLDPLRPKVKRRPVAYRITTLAPLHRKVGAMSWSPAGPSIMRMARASGR